MYQTHEHHFLSVDTLSIVYLSELCELADCGLR